MFLSLYFKIPKYPSIKFSIGLSHRYGHSIRENNKVKDYIRQQTEKFHDFEEEIIFGYEPLWAIGTGKVPKLDEIEEAAKTIKEFCGENKKILYGGSINSSNCKDILKLKEIDGALVGGASLNPKEFAMIAQSC